jgi:carboxylesterase type B
VTIWGQSSGATSVGYHLLAYNGRDDNLFRAAIMQSGNPTNFISFRDPAEYQLQYNALAAVFGCQVSFDSLNCLRLIPFPALNAAIILQNTVVSSSYISAWNPIVDGDIIARYGSQQLKEGAFVKVPIIVGATSDEGTVFSPFGVDTATEILSSMSDPSRLCNIPASLAPSALAAYPDEPTYYIPSPATVGNASIPSFFGNNQWRRSAAYWGDAIGVANRRAACEAWAAAGVPAYCFRFNTIVANTPAYIGATHFEDMSYVFDNTQGLGFKDNPFAGLPPANFDLAHLMSGSWASFAYDLDVNAFEGRYPSAVKWPQYETGNPQDIVWDATVDGLTFTETDDYRKEGIKWINDHALDYKR